MLKRLKSIGPGALVAAAFIGPGTVTACTLAGAGYGYALLWALVFATIATIILQEMAARLGTAGGYGLGEALRLRLGNSPFKYPLFALVLAALYMGNAAYEGGNLSGAVLGAQAIGGDINKLYFLLPLAALAGGLLWFGGYKILERILIVLVMLMALAFTLTFFLSGVNFAAMVKGMAVPSLPKGSLLIVLGLIGTTVVPYNLFLHASAAKQRWGRFDEEGTRFNNLSRARTDTFISVGLGGLISILIASTAAAGLFASGLKVENAADMAAQLGPIAGEYAPLLLGAGLLAAGLTSAITAPLATGYAVSEILGWEAHSLKFKLVVLSVLAAGVLIAMTGIKPLQIILMAQFANGLLLPIITGFLLLAMNQRAILGNHINGPLANVLGGSVLLITMGLGARLMAKTFGLI